MVFRDITNIMEHSKSEELSILIDDTVHAVVVKKLNQSAHEKRHDNYYDNKGGRNCVNQNAYQSSLQQATSLLDVPFRTDSSYEDCRNGASSNSSDNICDFFGNTSTSASSSNSRKMGYSSGSICTNHSNSADMEEMNAMNLLQHIEEDEENRNHKLLNYFAFLDDFIRFDVSRTGISCFSGYSIGIQYEDDFLVGNAASVLKGFLCGAGSHIRLWNKGGKSFELQYCPRVSCIKPKDCVYRVRISEQQASEIGTIHFQEDFVRICSSVEKCVLVRRKQGSSFYWIKTEEGEKQASVELFRGVRGNIIYYGLSILGNVSPTYKALLIALTITMDIRHRESEMRCSFLWLPLCFVVLIGIFSLLPWMLCCRNAGS